MTPSSFSNTRCCIVGGGPSGMMLGFLLARSGVPVVILEKHADFLRDFRGDTVHPSTLQIIKEIGLLEKFNRLPQRKVDHLSVCIGGQWQEVIDFRGLMPFDYLSLVPQWDFLDLLAEEGRRYPGFALHMRHEATGLIEKDHRVAGVRVQSPEGEKQVYADLVVACDGRHSILREAAAMTKRDSGAPMDVLWFRLPRQNTDPEDTFAIVESGHMMVLLNRTDYWQAAYVVPKGSDEIIRAKPIGTLRDSITRLAPFLAVSAGELTSWDDVKTLVVRVDCLENWYRAGLLLIGDAAHAMSPIGGVGINLAIQDAVAAANILAVALRTKTPIDEPLLREVQRRRMLPTRIIQALQVQAQKRLITKALEESGDTPRVPAILRWLLRFRAVRNIPARLVGYGIRREHVRTDQFSPTV